jgi:hypothetical protein
MENVYNVSASKNALYITVACSENWEEVGKQLSCR